MSQIRRIFYNFWLSACWIGYFLYDICLFYRHSPFRQVDSRILLHSLKRSPYRLSNRKRQEQNDDSYVYGETTLLAWDMIADHADLGPHNHVLELGCGRGRGAFWLSLVRGCQVTAVDQVSEFIDFATELAQRFDVLSVEFLCGNAGTLPLPNCDTIFCNHAFFATDILREIAKQQIAGQGQHRWITVGTSLKEEFSEFDIQIEKSFLAPFSWGQETVFIQSVQARPPSPQH